MKKKGDIIGQRFNKLIVLKELPRGDNVQTIYPATIEDMDLIISDLNDGDEVNGWEDGMGNTISIE